MDSAAGDAAFDRMDSKRRREVAFIEVQDTCLALDVRAAECLSS
jgi:hypothetical protein